MADGPLVELNPPAVLAFNLKRDQECRVRLYVRNCAAEGAKVAFKVKTTMPNCYFVKPNTGVLGAGGEGSGGEDKLCVDIVLTREEVNRLIELAASGIPEKTSKHRFMVQNKTISDAEYEQLSQEGQRTEKLSQLWATTDAEEKLKQDKIKKMLSVVFEYPAFTSAGASSRGEASAGPVLSVSESVELLRNKLAHESSATTAHTGSTAGFAPSSPSASASGSTVNGGTVVGDGMMTKERILEDMEKLQRKFDAMIQYTVSLTTERDALKDSLEEALSERAREAARAQQPVAGAVRAQGSEGAGAGAKGPKSGGKSTGAKKTAKNYFLEVPFPVLLLMVFVAFFAGKYIKR